MLACLTGNDQIDPPLASQLTHGLQGITDNCAALNASSAKQLAQLPGRAVQIGARPGKLRCFHGIDQAVEGMPGRANMHGSNDAHKDDLDS